MRYPQVLVYETDGVVARRLEALAKARKWPLREPRRPEACWRLLRGGLPSVLVLKLGRDLVAELELLERTQWLFPDTGVVVVGAREDPALAGLAWDLGADYVLFPPQPPDLLPDVVAGLMQGAIDRHQLAGKTPAGPDHPAPEPDPEG
jgi:hypothetical protein